MCVCVCVCARARADNIGAADRCSNPTTSAPTAGSATANDCAMRGGREARHRQSLVVLYRGSPVEAKGEKSHSVFGTRYAAVGPHGKPTQSSGRRERLHERSTAFPNSIQTSGELAQAQGSGHDSIPVVSMAYKVARLHFGYSPLPLRPPMILKSPNQAGARGLLTVHTFPTNDGVLFESYTKRSMTAATKVAVELPVVEETL